MPPASPYALPAGTEIGGFQIIRTLGAGGFGITYEAVSPRIRRRWAIKEFFPQGYASREDATRVVYSEGDGSIFARALDQFERSTQQLCELEHPNIVKVIHYIHENATGYMVMDYVEGQTLESWLRGRPGPPALGELRPIVEKVFDALEYAHSCNAIHRDIAPDNIIIRKDGSPVLIDFGSLKVIDPDAPVRISSLIVSKKYYSPPEQSAGSIAQPVIDVYSLAAVLYRALAGAPPTDSDDRKHALADGQRDPYVALGPREDIPLPRAARQAIDRALSYRSGDRPQTIREFRKSLGWEGSGVHAPEASRIAGGAQTSPGQPTRFTRSRRWAIGSVAAVSALAVAALALFTLRSPQPNPSCGADQLEAAMADGEAGLGTFLKMCPRGALADEARRRLDVLIDERESALARDAGFDMAKLQAYLATCTRCTVRADVNVRLALIKREEAAYQAAKGSVERLEEYAKHCKACVHRDAALKGADALRDSVHVKADDEAYNAAKGSIERLENYVKTCDLCRHREQALNDLAKLRDARKQKEQQDASKTKKGRLPLTAAQEQALRPKDSFQECDTCPEMVVMPAGSFLMGSPAKEQGHQPTEDPQHRVTFAGPFAVGKFEVTIDRFASFVEASGYNPGAGCQTFDAGKWIERDNRSWRNAGFKQDGSHPVVCINWNDAKAYAAWLSKKTGKTYRLLTEAEWEYAARGGTTTRYYFGANENALCRNGNGADQTAKRQIPGISNWTFAACDDGHAYTAPAGIFPANPFGLHDMHGNVWEWTEDCWSDRYKGAPANGSAWLAGNCSQRVFRGGSWTSDPGYLRSAFRSALETDARRYHLGFRVGRTLGP